MQRKLLAEILGTLALVFCLTCTIVRGGGGCIIAIAFALGFTVMVMIYALGRISGAHFNPAVTYAMVLARRMTLQDAVPYWIAQFIGAFLGRLLLWALIPHAPQAVAHFPYVESLGMTLPAGSYVDGQLQMADLLRSLIMEVGLTFFLVIVVLRVADGTKEMSLLAGIDVGAVLAMAVFVGFGTSGASMNPARSLAPALLM